MRLWLCSEVQGSTRKIYPQKGRGAARHGTIRAPIFVGGGCLCACVLVFCVSGGVCAYAHVFSGASVSHLLLLPRYACMRARLLPRWSAPSAPPSLLSLSVHGDDL